MGRHPVDRRTDLAMLANLVPTLWPPPFTGNAHCSLFKQCSRSVRVAGSCVRRRLGASAAAGQARQFRVQATAATAVRTHGTDNYTADGNQASFR